MFQVPAPKTHLVAIFFFFCYFLEIIKLLLYFTGGQWRRRTVMTTCSHTGPGVESNNRARLCLPTRMVSAETKSPTIVSYDKR